MPSSAGCRPSYDGRLVWEARPSYQMFGMRVDSAAPSRPGVQPAQAATAIKAANAGIPKVISIIFNLIRGWLSEWDLY